MHKKNITWEVNSEDYYYPTNENYEEMSCDEAYEMYYKNEELGEPECEFDHLSFHQDKKELFDFLKSKLEYETFVLDGVSNRWNGEYYYDLILTDLEEFEEKLPRGIDEIRYQLHKNMVLEVEVDHHDGTNYYKLIPLEKIRKSDLYDLLVDELNVTGKCCNKELKELYGKTLSKLNKMELVDAIIHYYYN